MVAPSNSESRRSLTTLRRRRTKRSIRPSSRSSRPSSSHSPRCSSLLRTKRPFVLEPIGGSVSLVRVHNFSVSLDGFGTGEGQSFETPFGHAAHKLNQWFFPTRTFREMQGRSDGGRGVDDVFASQW